MCMYDHSIQDEREQMMPLKIRDIEKTERQANPYASVQCHLKVQKF